MLTVTITYSSDLARFHRLEVEMTFLESALLQKRGLQVLFQLRDTHADKAKIFVKDSLTATRLGRRAQLPSPARHAHSLHRLA